MATIVTVCVFVDQWIFTYPRSHLDHLDAPVCSRCQGQSRGWQKWAKLADCKIIKEGWGSPRAGATRSVWSAEGTWMVRNHGHGRATRRLAVESAALHPPRPSARWGPGCPHPACPERDLTAARALRQIAMPLAAAPSKCCCSMIIKDGTVCWAEIKIEGDRRWRQIEWDKAGKGQVQEQR